MKVLVTGGAGYIGSHAVRVLIDQGHHPVVLDDLYRGHRDAVPDGVPFQQGSTTDTELVLAILREHAVECVMHFAALTYVGESVDEPLRYYEMNTAGTLSLLKAVDHAGVRRFVFSSTAATYGEPETMPITEDTPQQPINPYGRSKLMIEWVLRDYATACQRADKPFAFAALRYFNVAGAHPDGLIGEDHDPETHIVPVVLQAAMGTRDKITIFGEDYPTPDGTCIRDYVHVMDLAAAHVLVMQALQPGDARFYNLGTGQGTSVREIVESVHRVTGRDFTVDIGQRRAGDPPTLYADPARIQAELGWKAQHRKVDDMVLSAWDWHREHPNGYDDQTPADR